MENLIGVGNNRKIPFNPMILKKTEVTLSEPLHGVTATDLILAIYSIYTCLNNNYLVHSTSNR